MNTASPRTPNSSQFSHLVAAARAWQRIDPNPAHHQILEEEIAAQDDAALADRFSGMVSFGTAGLRAAEGPGPNRMNRVVVRRAAAGLADYLHQQLRADQRPPRVVIGYDARHGSEQFALDSAAVFVAAGVETHVLPAALPTPLLAFAVRHIDADAGVMVTASHNPPEDNGYKVYLGGRLTDHDGRGVQITTPADEHITACISTWAENLPPLAASGWSVLDEQIVQDYRQAAAQFLQQVAGDETGYRADLRIVYTAMHGVGAQTFLTMMDEAGFAPLIPVVEQILPDPDFPTVAFPNPEEPGALDLAMAAAAHHSPDVDLIIAHDPDADRLALVVPEASTRSDDVRWRRLTGDEVGLLLGHRLIPYVKQHRLSTASSFVSATAVERLMGLTDIPHSTTLTGFKWIARVPALGFGYEEALGYCVAPHLVRDKDGLTAGLVAADLAASLRARGSSLTELLEELQHRVGPTLTHQVTARVSPLSQLDELMDQLRSNPPHRLAGLPVTQVIDYAHARPAPAGSDEPAELPATNAISLIGTTRQLQVRVMVRPSGTEPKVKAYLEAIGPSEQLPTLIQTLTTEVTNLLRVAPSAPTSEP